MILQKFLQQNQSRISSLTKKKIKKNHCLLKYLITLFLLYFLFKLKYKIERQNKTIVLSTIWDTLGHFNGVLGTLQMLSKPDGQVSSAGQEITANSILPCHYRRKERITKSVCHSTKEQTNKNCIRQQIYMFSLLYNDLSTGNNQQHAYMLNSYNIIQIVTNI